MRWLAYGVAGLFVLIGLASLGSGDGAGGLAMVVIGVGGVLALNQWGNQVLEHRAKYKVFEFDVPVTAHMEVRATSERKAKRMLNEALEDGELPKGITVAGIDIPEPGSKDDQERKE